MLLKSLNRMRFTISLLFVLLFYSANSQVSGYMGKRAVIGYSNYFMLGFTGPGPNNSAPLGDPSFTINNVHCLNFDYAYKQRKMVCLSVQYLRTGMAYDKGNQSSFFSDSYGDYPYPNSSRYAGSFSKPALLTSVNYSIAVKTFKSGFIAPTGRYRKLEFLLLFEKLKYDSENFKVPAFSDDPVDDTLKTLGKGEYSFKNIAFAYSVGKQRILKDKFVLDYGIRFAYTPAMNIITIAAGDAYVSDVEGYFRRASNLRIARQQLINFHIGLGFLAF